MTIGASITVVGLDELRLRMRNSPKLLDAELRSAVRESSVVVRDEARRRAPGNKLPNSIQSLILTGGLRAMVGSVAKTALSIHQGRTPGSRAGFSLILAWVKRTGISVGSRMSIRTHHALRARAGSEQDRAERAEAARIVMLIRRRGTKPIPFVLPAAAPSAPTVMRLVSEATIRALRRVAH